MLDNRDIILVKVVEQNQKEEKMPPIFKALVSIIVWILFIKGCACIVDGTYISIAGTEPLLTAIAMCSEGIVALILAAVAAKLRQTLE